MVSAFHRQRVHSVDATRWAQENSTIRSEGSDRNGGSIANRHGETHATVGIRSPEADPHAIDGELHVGIRLEATNVGLLRITYVQGSKRGASGNSWLGRRSRVARCCCLGVKKQTHTEENHRQRK